MTAILEVLSTVGLVLLALALVLWGRHKNRRPPSTIAWPMDVYFDERRRRVETLNVKRHRSRRRREHEPRRREWHAKAAA